MGMKVLAADGISPKGIELLQKEFEVVVKDKISAEELLEIIPEFDALMVRSASKVTAEVIERAKNLKIIGRAGVGVDNIDIPAATAKGIMINAVDIAGEFMNMLPKNQKPQYTEGIEGFYHVISCEGRRAPGQDPGRGRPRPHRQRRGQARPGL